MNVSATNSPSFGKLKINRSNMTRDQYDLANQLGRILKNSDSYTPFDAKPIDVFILPKKGTKSRLEIRYADLSAEDFYRDNKKMIKQEYDGREPFEMADKIIETLGKLSSENKYIDSVYAPRSVYLNSSYIDGTNEVSKISPNIRKYYKNLILKESFNGDIGIHENKDFDF